MFVRRSAFIRKPLSVRKSVVFSGIPQLSAAGRIEKALRRRVDDFQKALDAWNKMHDDGKDVYVVDGKKYRRSSSGWFDDCVKSFVDDPVRKGKRLKLSRGERLDWFVVSPDSVVYHLGNWFDWAEVELCDSDKAVVQDVVRHLSSEPDAGR